ncbi:MAG: aminoglycoside phosphotransferase family protein [Spirochaetaceae bacterium]|jgi:hypothetical protein|nr:aminoglycoside phosphotransferase family protein [Spirochaetaceae bacterium]
MKTDFSSIANNFNLNAASINPFGEGHIHETYLVETGKGETSSPPTKASRETSFPPRLRGGVGGGTRYILQKVNTHVFKQPEAVCNNIALVTGWLKKKSIQTMEILPAKDGKSWFIDTDGGFWRVFTFIENSFSIEENATIDDLREAGRGFGSFLSAFSDFPASRLAETIPGYHDTVKRYAHFHETLQKDPFGRAGEARAETDFILQREEYAGKLIRANKAGQIPLRVTHNDTKLNNILFDKDTRKAIAVVDLDTVMPGLAAIDFGDAIRSGCATAAEDEGNLDKVGVDIERYQAFKKSWLSSCGSILNTLEKETLKDGAIIITLEQGLRFLTDYLEGDIYYKISHEKHNLDRTKNQLKLVAEMEMNL